MSDTKQKITWVEVKFSLASPEGTEGDDTIFAHVRPDGTIVQWNPDFTYPSSPMFAATMELLEALRDALVEQQGVDNG